MMLAMDHHWIQSVVYDLFFFVFLALLFLVNTCLSSTMRTTRMMRSLNWCLIQHAYCIDFDCSPLSYEWMKSMKIDLVNGNYGVVVAGDVAVDTTAYFAYTDWDVVVVGFYRNYDFYTGQLLTVLRACLGFAMPILIKCFHRSSSSTGDRLLMMVLLLLLMEVIDARHYLCLYCWS